MAENKNLYQVVKHQYVTEKSMMLQRLKTAESNPSLKRCESPKYVFIVDRNANKHQIALSVGAHQFSTHLLPRPFSIHLGVIIIIYRSSLGAVSQRHSSLACQQISTPCIPLNRHHGWCSMTLKAVSFGSTVDPSRTSLDYQPAS